MIYHNSLISIEVEPSEIPWVKVFANKDAKELSDCDVATREEIFAVILLIERTMLEYYQPEKINIASFANYLPKVHWHVMARFKTDSFWPEPVWGKKQREATLALPDFEQFIEILTAKLKLRGK